MFCQSNIVSLQTEAPKYNVDAGPVLRHLQRKAPKAGLRSRTLAA